MSKISNTQAPGAKQAMYADIRRRILTMSMQPGSDLDEVRLSSEYGLSRTPLREVLRQLDGEGFVQIEGNRGARVSPMDHRTIGEFFQAAPMIYSAITRLAVKNATRERIDELKAIQVCFRKAARKQVVDEMVFHNNDFHTLLGTMAENRYLVASLQRLLIDHTRIAFTFYDRKNAREGNRLKLAIEQHDQLIEAIDNGDEEEAVTITLAHWELSRSQADLFIKPDPLPLGNLAS